MDTAVETNPTSSPARSIRRDEVPALLAELDRTGEGIASLCHRRGLAPWRLYEANRRAKRGAQRAELTPVRVIEPACETAGQGARSAPPLRIQLGPVPSIDVPPGFDAATLRRVLDELPVWKRSWWIERGARA